MNSRGQRPESPGFTLIELMIVMGLMVLLIGSFGAAFRQTSGHALRSAQLQVASLVDRARMEAISQLSDARLVIDASDSDRFMRVLQVFVLGETGTWIAASPAVWLARGVCIVPPAGVVGSIEPLANLPAYHSNLEVDLAPRLASEDFDGATRTVYVEYIANGSLRKSDVNLTSITLATIGGRPGQTPVSNLSIWRSVALSANGTVTLEASESPP